MLFGEGAYLCDVLWIGAVNCAILVVGEGPPFIGQRLSDAAGERRCGRGSTQTDADFHAFIGIDGSREPRFVGKIAVASREGYSILGGWHNSIPFPVSLF
jgi:hypothetical protein